MSGFQLDTSGVASLKPCEDGFVSAMADASSHSGREWVMRRPNGDYQKVSASDLSTEARRSIERLCQDYGDGDELSFAEGAELYALNASGRLAELGFPVVGEPRLGDDGLIYLREAGQ